MALIKKGVKNIFLKKYKLFEKFVLSKKNRRKIYILLFVNFLIFGLFITQKYFVSAYVNRIPIWRFSIIKTLEKQGGKQVLETEIGKLLLMQEAKKNNLSISAGEINEEIDKIKSNLSEQGIDYETALSTQQITEADLINNIKLQKISERLLADKVVITDEEIAEYFEKNKTFFPENSTLENSTDQIRARLSQQKLSQKLQTYLSELRQKAVVKEIVKY